MTIKEAEKLTGVSSRNIRFYEQKGLLTPVRNRENDYREYSDGDVERLKLIRALRMVDMPLEQIREVVDGKVELHKAAIMQKEILEEQMKKLKTVIRFCEELSEAEPENVSEVLMRMDQPDNRKFFSKEWRTDYAEKVKRVCIPLFAGLAPALVSLLLYMPMVLAAGFAHGYMFVVSLLIWASWVWIGKRMYREKGWLRHTALFAVFPIIGLLILLYDGPKEWVGSLFLLDGEWRQLYFMQYLVPLSVLIHRFDVQKWHYIVFFLINMGCFALGMLLSWRAVRKNGSFLGRIFDARPLLTVTTILLFALILLTVPAFVMDLSPNYYDPAGLKDYCTNQEECVAQTEDGTVWFEVTDEFAEIACFDQWERKYWRNFGAECLKIDNEEIDAATYMTFYDNDCVTIYVDGWLGPGRSYSFQVPEGVAEELEAYICEHTIREAEEE